MQPQPIETAPRDGSVILTDCGFARLLKQWKERQEILKINEEKLIPGVVKIFLSNLGQEQDVARGKSLGAVGYIVKANSTPSEVVAKVIEIAHIE